MLLLIAIAPLGAVASEPIGGGDGGKATYRGLIVEQSIAKHQLSHVIQVLEDPSATLTLNDIIESHQSGFQSFEGLVPSFGYTSSAYWVRFRISNLLPETQKWVLEVPYAPLDLVQVYWQTDSGYHEKSAGDGIPFSERDIDYPMHAFNFETSPLQQQWVYVRVSTTSTLQIPLFLWSEKAFESAASSSLLFWGVYFGALLIAAAYNLFLFMTLRDRVYGLYVAFVMFMALFQFIIHGFASQYLWPNNPEVSNYALFFSLTALGMCSPIFSIEFLRIKLMQPRMYKILLAIVAMFGVVTMLSPVVDYAILMKVTISIYAFGPIVLIIAGCNAVYQGYKPARVYLLAWVALLFGVITFALKSLGYIPANVYTNYAATIGSAIEAFLLSLAVGGRVEAERVEKETAQAKLVNMQKQLLSVNEKALETAKQSDRLKQEFLATMSHELRTPLNGILGCSQLLEESSLSEDDRSTISYLTSSAKQMLSHVNRILNFSQLHEGKLKKSEIIFEIESIVKALELAYQGRCVEKGVSFDVKLDASVSGYYKGDKHKILMILSDLIENAIKFTKRGSVEVFIVDHGLHETNEKTKFHRVSFHVKDTGCGIDVTNKEHIFNMFAQSDSSFKREYEGLGLGLAICQKYVDLLDGEIAFESEFGKGATFNCSFPLAPCVPVAKRENVVPQSAAYESDQKILVVEDNPTNQMILVKMLKNLGYRSALAEDGVAALELLEKETFDVVLMDCHMPLMDGFEATTKIRNSNKDFRILPIIAVTANTLEGDRERCLDVGMNDYIAKPFAKELLASKLKFWLINHPAGNFKSD